MAKAYSLDLGKKVISFVGQGRSKRKAAKLFNMGEDTIYRWIRRDKLGDLAPKKRTEFPTKVPLEKLRKYVEDHPDHTLKEIGIAVGLARFKFEVQRALNFYSLFFWLKPPSSDGRDFSPCLS